MDEYCPDCGFELNGEPCACPTFPPSLEAVDWTGVIGLLHETANQDSQ